MTLYRADGLLDLSVVNRQKIVVVGAGSLGSLAIENLAYPWQKIVVIDPEILEADNVERHLLSTRYIGRPKVEGVKDWLMERGVPANRILAHQGLAQDILYEHADASLCIVAVDNRKAKIAIDNWARASNIPMLIGGIYPMGNGGHTIVLPRPNDVCYACAAHVLGEDAYQGKQSDDYGVPLEQLLDGEGNLHKVPSLRAPIAAIAADVAMMALEILKGGEVPSHILYHAIGWETLLTLNSGSQDTLAVTNYIVRHQALGLVPHIRLKIDEGRLNMQIRNGILPVKLDPWANCPNHDSSAHALDEI